MEICIIGPDLNPPFTEAQRNMARELGIQLTYLGHNVHIVTDNSKKLPCEETIDGLHLHRLSSRMFAFEAVKKMSELNERYHFDVVHCQNLATKKSFILMKGLRERLGVPVVAYVCLQPSLSFINWIFEMKNDAVEGLKRMKEFTPRLITRNALGAVDQIVTSSDFLRGKIAKAAQIDRDKIEVIHPFINFENFARLASNFASRRADVGVSETSPLFLFVGTHSIFRGEAEFSRAFALLLKEYPDAKAALFVSSHFPTRIIRLAKSLNIEKSLIFIHEVNYESIATLMAASDVYVFCGLSSLSGGSIDPPLTIIEAMALGKSCVAYNFGGVKELIQFGNISLVEPHRVYELVSKMSQALKEKRTNDNHQERKRALINEFDSKTATKRFLSIYEKAICQ